MRDREVPLHIGGKLAAGPDGSRAWLELTKPDGTATTLELSEGELLMAIEALAMVYADVVGARADSIAYGVSRTLRNRTQAARERRRRRRPEAA